MDLNGLITAAAKDVQLEAELKKAIEQGGFDPNKSARVAFALVSIGVAAFRANGDGCFRLGMLLNALAHGVSSETALKALMSVQEEDEHHDTLRGRTGTGKATVN